MVDHEFVLAGHRLVACADGALWWPEEQLLCVSDLHLGKSERLARRSGLLLPPYDVHATLIGLRDAIAALSPATVICLGDSFDDLQAEKNFSAAVVKDLTSLMAGRNWIWITGNHDPGPVETGGSWCSTYSRGNLTFRHIAQDEAQPGEVSGHYHPKTRVAGRTRACFCYDKRRLILPAFGTYTGGLAASDPAISRLFGEGAVSILTGKKAIPVPFHR